MESKSAHAYLDRKVVFVFATVAALAMAACSQQGHDATQSSLSGSTERSQTAPQPEANSAVAKFSIYTSTIPASFDNKQCSVDLINGHTAENAPPMASGGTVDIGGWAGNGRGQAANGFLLLLKGGQTFAAPIQTTVAREDVAKAWNSEGMSSSGFNLSASLAGVDAGEYALYIADPSNPANVCDAHRKVTVQ